MVSDGSEVTSVAAISFSRNSSQGDDFHKGGLLKTQSTHNLQAKSEFSRNFNHLSSPRSQRIGHLGEVSSPKGQTNVDFNTKAEG